VSKRSELGEQARELYVIHGMTLRAISQKLVVSERTLQTWKSEELWDDAKASLTGSESGFHKELFDLGRVVARKIRDDLQNGKELDNRIYHLERIINTAIKSRGYEQLSAETVLKTDATLRGEGDKRTPAERRKAALTEIRKAMGLDG